MVVAATDDSRSMKALAQAIVQRSNDDPFQRVTYGESHDEVANGKARVPHEIDAENPEG
jgi:1,4-alpha-glucan branching enzyme